MKQHNFIDDNTSINSYISDLCENSSISSEYGCRICTEPVDNKMKFCKCLGYVAIVHKECLIKWLSISKKDHCEICNYKFNLKITQKFILTNLFFIIIFILGTIFAYLYTYLNTQNNDPHINLLSGSTIILLIVLAINNNKHLFIKKTIDINEDNSENDYENNENLLTEEITDNLDNNSDNNLNFHPLIITDDRYIPISQTNTSNLAPTESDRLLE
jgi:hypothetical protein